MFYDLPCVSIAFHWVLLTFHWVLPLSYLISSYLLILSYLFLVFCFPARFWCWDICDGFKYPRGYPHVRQRESKFQANQVEGYNAVRILGQQWLSYAEGEGWMMSRPLGWLSWRRAKMEARDKTRHAVRVLPLPNKSR